MQFIQTANGIQLQNSNSSPQFIIQQAAQVLIYFYLL